MRTYSLLLVTLTIFASGCSSQAVLTVYSQPTGAYITEIDTGAAFGIAPTNVAYVSGVLKLHRDFDGCYRMRGIRAQWVSGAYATMDPVRICGSPRGSYQIVLARNSSLPGMEKDLQFAIQVEATRAQQQQAQAASDAALIAAYMAIQQSQPTQCRSVLVGEAVQTVCQ